jgi:ribonuclease HI
MIEIYTDGSCLGNPGPGGWAAIILDKDKNEFPLSGGEKVSTNNRMEMTAIFEALEFVKKNFKQKEDKIMLFSDSNLLVQSINLGWKRNKNIDLWEKIDSAMNGLKIEFQWVKAHAQNKLNNKCDRLAQAQARKIAQQ